MTGPALGLAPPLPVGLEAPQRLGAASGPLIEAGEVEVRVAQLRIRKNGGPIRFDGVVRPPEVFQGDGEVELGGGVQRPHAQRQAVMPLRARRIARFVEQPAQVDLRIRVCGVRGDRPEVGGGRGLGVAGLELAAALVPGIPIRALARGRRFDHVVALDVGLVGDIPTVGATSFAARLGGGPIVVHKDALVAYDHSLSWALGDLADQTGVSWQHGVFAGYGSDGVPFIQEGMPTALVCIPTRYTHSPFEMIDPSDVDGTVQLLTAYVTERR